MDHRGQDDGTDRRLPYPTTDDRTLGKDPTDMTQFRDGTPVQIKLQCHS